MVYLHDDVKAAIQDFKAAAQRTFGDRLVRVLLFGSTAQGRVHEESDVDLLVLVARRLPRDGHRAVDVAVEVMLRRPEVVLSPLVMTPEELDELRSEERRLAQEIDRDGIPL